VIKNLGLLISHGISKSTGIMLISELTGEQWGLSELRSFLEAWIMHCFPFLFCVIVYTFIHMCIHCLGHFSPMPLDSLLLTPTPLTSRQKLFYPILEFYWRENIRDNKKDIAFLLDWDSYIERFLALFPCTCILQPELIHLYKTSSLLPSSLSQYK
jgi:hypothetical protein